MIVKLVIGQICAGKTTYCLGLAKKNYVRLSMDDLKIMMFGSLPSDKKSEDIITASMENILSMIDGIDDNRNAVIDGFQLDIEALRYLISCFNVKIKVFTVDLFKANKRNKRRQQEDGLYIDPEDIKKYNDAFVKFVNSEKFKEVTKSIEVTYVHNYEKTENCLVM